MPRASIVLMGICWMRGTDESKSGEFVVGFVGRVGLRSAGHITASYGSGNKENVQPGSEVSICTGFRPTDPYRDRAWAWCRARWEYYFPEAEIIVADSTAPSFNRAEARNNAARACTRPIIIFADADVVFDPAAVTHSIDIARDGGWAIPYRTSWGYFRLGRSYSQRVLRLPPSYAFPELRRGQWMANLDYSRAGIQILPRQALDRAGWWDERFIGWGSEDWTWYEVMRILWGEPFHPEEHVLLHLWHPVRYRERQGQPHIGQNLELGAQLVEEARARAAERQGGTTTILGEGSEGA